MWIFLVTYFANEKPLFRYGLKVLFVIFVDMVTTDMKPNVIWTQSDLPNPVSNLFCQPLLLLISKSFWNKFPYCQFNKTTFWFVGSTERIFTKLSIHFLASIRFAAKLFSFHVSRRRFSLIEASFFHDLSFDYVHMSYFGIKSTSNQID